MKASLTFKQDSFPSFGGAGVPVQSARIPAFFGTTHGMGNGRGRRKTNQERGRRMQKSSLRGRAVRNSVQELRGKRGREGALEGKDCRSRTQPDHKRIEGLTADMRRRLAHDGVWAAGRLALGSWKPLDVAVLSGRLRGSGNLGLTLIFRGCNFTRRFNRLMNCARSSAWIERRPAEPKVTRSNRVGHAICLRAECSLLWIIPPTLLT